MLPSSIDAGGEPADRSTRGRILGPRCHAINPLRLEPKWQRFWEQNATFRTPDMPAGEKIYILDMFPYPER